MVRLPPSAYRLPPELLAYMEYARNHKEEVLVMKSMPMAPVRIKGEFYDLVYTGGPLLTHKLVPGTGRLLAIA